MPRWVYWVTVGWVWEPLKWAGRVGLWLIFWPAGLWRSLVKSHRRSERRIARSTADRGGSDVG